MRKISGFILTTAFMVPLFAAGCAEHARVYAWSPGETSYYVQWESQTHRHHEDYQRRSQADQRAYWKWRHHDDHHHPNDHQ